MKFVPELNAPGTDSHARQNSFVGCMGLTAFLYAVNGTLEWNPRWREPQIYHLSRDFRLNLRKIVETLHCCELDLDAFGPIEEFGRQGNPGVNLRFKISHQAVKMAKIHHGPSVDDWRLEWGFTLSNEDLVDEFWHMVETPSQNVPGAWPESASDLDTDSETISDIDGGNWQFA